MNKHIKKNLQSISSNWSNYYMDFILGLSGNYEIHATGCWLGQFAVWGVSITCMQTNVQWPAYEAPRYPLWPSELVRPLPVVLLQLLQHMMAAQSRRNHNLQNSIFCFCFSFVCVFFFKLDVDFFNCIFKYR